MNPRMRPNSDLGFLMEVGWILSEAMWRLGQTQTCLVLDPDRQSNLAGKVGGLKAGADDSPGINLSDRGA